MRCMDEKKSWFLHSGYYVSGTIQNTLHLLAQLILTDSLIMKYYHPHLQIRKLRLDDLR